MIKVSNLLVKYNNQIIIDTISFDIYKNSIISLIGESGAGKTTLLRALVGLIPLKSGEVLIDNIPVLLMNKKRRSELIGYVFQHFNLFKNLTVLENCIDPLLVHGFNYQDANEKAIEWLNQFGMTDFKNKYPFNLSGGQQQRVAIARSLCLTPKVLLLDEPTASLDPKNTNILIRILKDLAKRGFCIILASQDMNFVYDVFDEIFYIDKGKIVDSCNDRNHLFETNYIAPFFDKISKKLKK
ncbi:amino acid ABC transporter ATP-binding protein [Candidatus Dependentiae bacterium]|nr:amino acid ABC transporter ATP-binding protein [Candidatus Dependentiae bacterium]